MDDEVTVSFVDTHGTAPLISLIAAAEERVRRLGEHLEERGVLPGDETAAALLADARVKLVVAKARIRGDETVCS